MVTFSGFTGYSDASISMDFTGVYSNVILDSEENIIFKYTEIVDYTDNVNYVEYLGLESLIDNIISSKIAVDSIRIDSLNVYNHLVNGIPIGDNYQYLYERMKTKIINQFDISKIKWIESSFNKAHNHCKEVVNNQHDKLSKSYQRVFCTAKKPKFYAMERNVMYYYKEHFANNKRVNFENLQKLLTLNILMGEEVELPDQVYLYIYLDKNIYVHKNTIISIEKTGDIVEQSNNKLSRLLERLLKIKSLQVVAS